MSLSERLKQAHQERSSTQKPADTVIDLTHDEGPVLDLTGPTEGISYSPIGMGAGSVAFGDFDPGTVDRPDGTACPRCGGPTHLDMFDQVHQMASLSCLTCFHMFSVEA